VTDYFERDQSAEAPASEGTEVAADLQEPAGAATPETAEPPATEVAAADLPAEVSAPEEAIGVDGTSGPEAAMVSASVPEESSDVVASTTENEGTGPSGERETKRQDEPATPGEGGGEA